MDEPSSRISADTARGDFVLVHGAWHGAWCWDRMTPLLEGEGFRVHAPTLAGLGARAALLSHTIDLDTHIADVVCAIEAHAAGPVILAGHSYGGVIVTGVADRRPDLVRQLIYLDALIVENGESIASRWLEGAERAAVLAPGPGEPAGRAPLPPESFDLDMPGDIDWVAARLTPHPVGTYRQPLALRHGFGNGIARAFIFCSAAANPMIGSLRGRLPGPAPAWTIHDLAAGHDAMITAPAELAALLVAIASGDVPMEGGYGNERH